MVAHATQMPQLHARLRAAQAAHDRETYQWQIDASDATDSRIDALGASRELP